MDAGCLRQPKPLPNEAGIRSFPDRPWSGPLDGQDGGESDGGRQHARGVARAMSAGLTRGELAQLETICQKLAWANDTSEVPIP